LKSLWLFQTQTLSAFLAIKCIQIVRASIAP